MSNTIHQYSASEIIATHGLEAVVRDKRVKAIFSQNAHEVQKAIEELITTKEGTGIEEQLITLVEHWEKDDGYASLWALVILGYMHSVRAIPSILAVIDSDTDYWREAAMESLERIAKHYPDEIFMQATEFIEDRFDHDTFDARLFAYSALSALAPRDDAKQFLLYAFERDDKWQASIAQDLEGFSQDARIREFFKPAIAYSRRIQDPYSYDELCYAYTIFDSDPFELREKDPLSQKPWKERWSNIFAELSKPQKDEDEDNDEEDNNADDFTFLEEDKKELKRIRAENQRQREAVYAHPIEPFHLDAYLALRSPRAPEHEFDQALHLLGLAPKWSVESVQLFIDKETNPSASFGKLFQESPVRSEESARTFLSLFMNLWNTTPRTEFDGLTPEKVFSLKKEREGIPPLGSKDPCWCFLKRPYSTCHGMHGV